ncbi:MAG TPA: hypothetical protein VHY22_06825 [Chthoniobacteraceae bacterium]|nr:hypothetical protein [Chthoniobacteraceae bacterium]
MNAIYVKMNGVTISRIQREFPAAIIEPGELFIGAVLPNSACDPPHDKLAALSSEIGGDVIWLSFQSASDSSEFHHWSHARILRSLVFGCWKDERTWELALGETEPWETEVFFNRKMLEFALRFAVTEEEKHEFERIWRDTELLPGRTEPSIDARESAREIACYYKFPGWD